MKKLANISMFERIADGSNNMQSDLAVFNAMTDDNMSYYYKYLSKWLFKLASGVKDDGNIVLYKDTLGDIPAYFKKDLADYKDRLNNIIKFITDLEQKL